MKSHRSCGVALRAAALVLSLAGIAHGDGFVWQRSADWVPGSGQGGTGNNPGPGAGGNTVWYYEWTEGGPLGSTNPWFRNPGNRMSWDPEWYQTGWGVWSRGNDANPPILPARLVHNVHESAVHAIPLVRWVAPLGPMSDLAITGSLTVNWNGLHGLGLPVAVDVVIAKQNAAQTSTTLLFSQTVSKPNNFPSVGDSLVLPINLQNISMNTGDSIIITHRGRQGFGPNGGWVNLYDNISFSAIPSPGALGVLGLGAIAVLRRRRR
jgi:hypothetical protein